MPLFSKKPVFKSVAVQKPRIVEEKVESPKPPPPKPRALPHLDGSRLHAAAAAGRTSSSSPRASPRPNGHGGSRLSPAVAGVRGKSASPFPSSSDERGGLSRKRKANAGAAGTGPRRSPASDRIEFGEDSSESDDDDDNWEDRLDARKRRKQAARQNGGGRADPKRELRHPVLLAGGAGAGAGVAPGKPNGEDNKQAAASLQFIHAADVASLKHKCLPTLGASEDEVAVELQYPGSRQTER